MEDEIMLVNWNKIKKICGLTVNFNPKHFGKIHYLDPIMREIFCNRCEHRLNSVVNGKCELAKYEITIPKNKKKAHKRAISCQNFTVIQGLASSGEGTRS